MPHSIPTGKFTVKPWDTYQLALKKLPIKSGRVQIATATHAMAILSWRNFLRSRASALIHSEQKRKLKSIGASVLTRAYAGSDPLKLGEVDAEAVPDDPLAPCGTAADGPFPGSPRP
jgi:hypothetical protein